MYRTPELVEFHVTGKKPPPASDVFQLGLVACEMFTRTNPLRPGGPRTTVRLDPLQLMAAPAEEAIRARLEEMIVIDTEARLPARRLLPLWLDLYRIVSGHDHPKRRDPVQRLPSGGE
jgi:hypothetical protein